MFGIPFDSYYISLTVITNFHSHIRENYLIIHLDGSECNQNQFFTLKGEEPKGPHCKHIQHTFKKKESIPSFNCTFFLQMGKSIYLKMNVLLATNSIA